MSSFIGFFEGWVFGANENRLFPLIFLWELCMLFFSLFYNACKLSPMEENTVVAIAILCLSFFW